MKRIMMALIMLVTMSGADTELTEPKPSFDNPRQIVFSVTEGDDKAINHVLSAANNVLKFYGPENVEMRIVAYSGGIRTLLKKEKAIAVRVDALMQYGVVFVACDNTLRTKKIDKSELTDGSEIVTAGIVEMIERVKSGWTYIKP